MPQSSHGLDVRDDHCVADVLRELGAVRVDQAEVREEISRLQCATQVEIRGDLDEIEIGALLLEAAARVPEPVGGVARLHCQVRTRVLRNRLRANERRGERRRGKSRCNVRGEVHDRF